MALVALVALQALGQKLVALGQMLAAQVEAQVEDSLVEVVEGPPKEALELHLRVLPRFVFF